MSEPPRSWSYFNTPLPIYLLVTGPITLLMVILCALGSGWIRYSAAAVIAVSLVNLYRGYGRRLRLGPDGVSFNHRFVRIDIPWSQVRRIGCYKPPQGFLGTQYIFITRRHIAPDDPQRIDADTIQVQNRPRLLETLEALWRSNGAPSC